MLFKNLVVFMLKIRFARGGRTHQAFFSIVVANARSKRDAGFIEKIGFRNPLAKKDGTHKEAQAPLSINEDRLKYWLSVGAIPTQSLVLYCIKNGIQGLEKFKDPIPEKGEFYGISKKDKKKTLGERKAAIDKIKKEKDAAIEKAKKEKEAALKAAAVAAAKA